MAKFDIKKIVGKLVENLSDRSKDIVLSRFGVGKDDYETLEAIGQRYGITRERVRQIEEDGLKHIRSPSNESIIKPIIVSLSEFIKSRGGVMEESELKREFSLANFESKTEPARKYEGAAILFLNLGNFVRTKEDDDFWPRWAIDKAFMKSQEGLVSYLTANFKKGKKTANDEELLSLSKSHDSSLNKDGVLAYLASAKNISRNVFGEWGIVGWPEISPRGVRDKAYLVMKRFQKPMHFTQVAEEINKSSFSTRIALPQTVHNELIKDGRFVLVGRGLYALKDWGYETGTVRDVIKSVLVSSGPMDREEIVKAVLAKRVVKPSTIILNLNGFKKKDDNKYYLG